MGYWGLKFFLFKRLFFSNFSQLQGPPSPPYTTAGGALGVQIEALSHSHRLELFPTQWDSWLRKCAARSDWGQIEVENFFEAMTFGNS